jgi:esterase
MNREALASGYTAHMQLAQSIVSAEGAAPSRSAVFLHGLLGRGSNWQGFARKLVAARPEWDALLLDLRMHGESLSLPPPHTLARAAGDVRAALAAASNPASAVIGHSFGGKVALLLAADPPPGLEQIWVLDATPSARARDDRDVTTRVLAALGEMPQRFTSRNQFAAEFASRGVDAALGPWLAKNLVREDDGLRLALDLDAIGELLADFDRNDLWPLLEAPPPGVALRVVTGGRSHAISPPDRERLRAAAERSAIAWFELPDAGHWLHSDDPTGLLQLLTSHL